jgi:ArsR family transcriptional regulator
MDLVSFYKCLSDPTRLRIVNLLLRGPLCVCQIQDVLQEAQVKTSKHLGYMKKRELLVVKRKANWNFYELDSSLHPIAQASLQAIEAKASEDPTLATDLARLQDSQDSDCY